MKFTKLSLIAALAVSAAVAGGDIVEIPQAPAVEACNDNTTINGKLQGYYITDDSNDDMFGDDSQLGLAATLDVSHKFNDWLTANFSAVGYVNAMKQPNLFYMESNKNGAFFNVANLTATFGDTTFVAGRQLLDTPMLGGFDWLLAPGAFEAYTLVNKSISNVTLIGSYVAKWRPNNTGDNFINLADNGDNWALGAVYSDAFNASLWYYNVDAGNYTQVYADAGVTMAGVELAAQYAGTEYDTLADSTAYGVKIATTVANFNLSAAYNHTEDNVAGFVGKDAMYTSSWNIFAATDLGDSFKVAASTEYAGVNIELSYADYETAGEEFDLILGYAATKCISFDAVYTNTAYNETMDNVNALELVATYKF